MAHPDPTQGQLTLKEECVELLTEWRDQLTSALAEDGPSEALSAELYGVNSVLAQVNTL